MSDISNPTVRQYATDRLRSAPRPGDWATFAVRITNKPGPRSGVRSVRSGGEDGLMLKPYIVYYTYKCPGDKKQGPVRQFRIYATTWDEARSLAARHSTYPDIEVLRIKQA